MKTLFTKFIIAVGFSVPLFYIAMGPMISKPFGPWPVPSIIDPMINPLNYALIQMILVIPVMIAGYKFYINGFKSLINRNPNMDTLVAIGTSAAFLYSAYTTFKIATTTMEVNHGHHQLYFESAGIIIALILLGIVVLACMNLILSIITYVIALIIIVSGLMKIENALDIRRMGCHWIPLLVFAIICIILGISVLTMPMNHNDDGTRTAGDFLIQCSGAIFAVTGLIDLITTLSVSGKIKKWIDSQMN